MCLYPRLIHNKKYTETSKNGGNIPAVRDERVLRVPKKCGNCMECRKQYAREWSIRLMEEIKVSTNGKFVTLTLNTNSIKELIINSIIKTDSKGNKYKININDLKGYDKDNAIITIAIRRFLERWRKEFKKSPRHWFVTEIGGGKWEHIHIHGIIWTNEKFETIEKIWNYGFICPSKENYRYNFVSNRTVNYMVKYIHKIDEKHKTYKPIVLCSHKPGIGHNYMNTYNAKLTIFNNGKTKAEYICADGRKIALPTYYRNKLYNDDQREALWLHTLDKEIRYVLGEKIDISKGEEIYYKVLEEAQKKNNELKFGNDKVDWKRKVYEMERREIIIKKRLD